MEQQTAQNKPTETHVDNNHDDHHTDHHEGSTLLDSSGKAVVFRVYPIRFVPLHHATRLHVHRTRTRTRTHHTHTPPPRIQVVDAGAVFRIITIKRTELDYLCSYFSHVHGVLQRCVHVCVYMRVQHEFGEYVLLA